jgi:hypothetical protein
MYKYIPILFLLGCEVTPEAPPEPVPCEPYQSCTATEQYNNNCTACSEPLIPKETASPDLVEFYNCYGHIDSGSLQGDGTKCEAVNPKGAEEWQEVVAVVCQQCSDVCCYTCAVLPYGRLAP